MTGEEVFMSRFRSITSGLCALGLGLTGLVLSAGPAAAAHVGCGAVITQNTTLDSDVGPCTGDGLVVPMGTSNITIDLSGHRVFSVRARGDIAGVRLVNTTKVTLQNGRVEGFNDGVAIFGGSANTVQGITAVNNVSDFGVDASGGFTGDTCDLGDGIGLFDSPGNLIRGNTANNNGPYGGISLVGHSSGNQILGNTTNMNNIASPTGDNHPNCIDNEQQDEGIRIEGPGAQNNQLKGNTVNGNLLAGIGIHAANNIDPGADATPSSNNFILGNKLSNNGHTSGDNNDSGISILGTPGVRSFGNTITGNTSTNNFANGIYVPATSHDNNIQGNTVNSNQKDGIYLTGPSFGNRFTNVGPTLFQQVSPNNVIYVQGTDYAVLSGSGSGNATARLVPVGAINIPPTGFDTSTSGCSPADFAGFPPGAVALVQRGFCDRATKVANAQAAGASAVIMFNEGSPGRTGLLTAGVNPTTIPVLGTTYALGVQLYNLTQAGPVTVHVITNTTNVRVQTGPGAENNTLDRNRGVGNAEHDGHDNNLAPPCDNNRWSGNLFGTVNQACVAAGGTGTVKP
ncbi:MAG: hypothetical protein DLM54_10775 [Acidimicrobiales bacterium]|nr:MAG: hypothetical protein DLM54_10775 [Acidimicrobiales bacterium]